MKNLIVDVDGVLTTGQMIYSSKGKEFKIFGADDNDALSLLSKKISIHMISGDKNGFPISSKRVKEHMGYPISLVSTFNRVQWIKSNFSLKETIYIGDGIFDFLVFDKVAYAIAPQNAHPSAKKAADFITDSKGGEGAVAEACLHILKKFFDISDIKLLITQSDSISSWKTGKK
ncbi:HAD hydrolase family protein [bacterium]|jgi:3-deoxy-D-manno-octulosonate 8-phosphate phosphatase (KDO 8-P phosphatase)|nr:HAD hydrolase family protein [bacterium]